MSRPKDSFHVKSHHLQTDFSRTISGNVDVKVFFHSTSCIFLMFVRLHSETEKVYHFTGRALHKELLFAAKVFTLPLALLGAASNR